MSRVMNKQDWRVWLTALSIMLGLLLLFIFLGPAEATIEPPILDEESVIAELAPFIPFPESDNPPAVTFTLALLKNELDVDPEDFGYSTLTNFEAANVLNGFSPSNIVTKETLTALEMLPAVIISEHGSLTQIQRDAWQMIMIGAIGGGIQLDNPAIRDQAAEIWAPGTTTRDNLIALQFTDGSRAEELWGEGTSITDKQVEEARLLL